MSRNQTKKTITKQLMQICSISYLWNSVNWYKCQNHSKERKKKAYKGIQILVACQVEKSAWEILDIT